MIEKKLGCPMGRFLSPRIANTTLAQCEWDIFEMASSLGLVMVLVRYMDDVLCAIAYTSEREKYLGSCILTLLKESYPYPLDLQWEDRSNQYNFLEMEVLTEEDRLWCRYQSKWRTAMESKDRAYVRVPNGKDGHSTLDRYRYLRNTIIRICDGCTYTSDIQWYAVLVAMEMIDSMWLKSAVCNTLLSVASQRKKAGEGDALIMAKQIVEWLG